jgi:hypothetical protein
MDTKTIVLERQNVSTTTFEVEVPSDFDEDELGQGDPTELREALESDPDVSLVQITETFDDEVGILEDNDDSDDEEETEADDDDDTE